MHAYTLQSRVDNLLKLILHAYYGPGVTFTHLQEAYYDTGTYQYRSTKGVPV